MINYTSDFQRASIFMKTIRQFMLIDDDLKKHKLEWIFGISNVLVKKTYAADTCAYGLELVDYISEDSVSYRTTHSKSSYASSLYGMIYRERGEAFCLRGIKEMLTMCLADSEICKAVYEMEGPTY